jgi:hypothetical protein
LRHHVIATSAIVDPPACRDGKEFDMQYVEACDASPLNAAINRTGMRIVVGVRLGGHPQSPVAWAVQRDNTREWVDVDIINYPVRLDVDANAWEPLTAWPTSMLTAESASFHQERPDCPFGYTLQGAPRRSSYLDRGEK